jgi:hypothetical protein
MVLSRVLFHNATGDMSKHAIKRVFQAFESQLRWDRILRFAATAACVTIVAVTSYTTSQAVKVLGPDSKRCVATAEIVQVEADKLGFPATPAARNWSDPSNGSLVSDAASRAAFSSTISNAFAGRCPLILNICTIWVHYFSR